MNFLFGIGLLLVAAVVSGSFALPMKYAKRWNWEIIWAVFTLLALVLMPWLVTLLRVPNFADIYASCAGRDVMLTVAFGIGWGTANVLYGLALSMLGISLSNSIMAGLGPSIGSVVPLVVLHREKVFAPEGLSILAGVVMTLFGIYLCGVAGQAREMRNAEMSTSTLPRRYGLGLFICILSGVLAPMITLALAFGAPIMKRAVAMGVSATEATYLIWALVLPAGSLISVLYCLHLMNKNGSWNQFKLPGTRMHWLLALAMAVLWSGGLLLLGFSTVYLGPLGVPIAQAVFVIFLILGSNAVGLLIGEWRGVKGAPMRRLGFGIGLLAVACVVIAIGNR